MGYLRYISFLLLVFVLSTACSAAQERQNLATYETWSIIEGKQVCNGSECLQYTVVCPQGSACLQSTLSIRADEILGFKYEDGYRYKIVVKVASPPNEASAKYEFVGVIEKTLAMASSN